MASKVFSATFKVKDNTTGNATIEITDLKAGTGDEAEYDPIATAQDTSLLLNIIEKKEDSLDLKPEASDKNISMKGEYIILPAGTTFNEFKAFIEPTQEPEYHSRKGSTVDTSQAIKTGDNISVGEKTWTFSVRGDVDGDGEVTVNDLSRVKLHFIRKITLEGAYLEAAETDNDGDPATVNDISRFKLVLIEKIPDLFSSLSSN